MRLVVLMLCLLPTVARAQAWNDSAAVALVTRAVARRTAVEGDSGLRSWQVRAHGMVLFLATLGEGGTGTPRLIKADELDVEVYWSAPGRSKQVIRGWRDRRYLPTDIHYHRDHLGIVTDGYGPRIRIGEGDEVRDVVHPLSVEGLTWYDFALRDSVQVVTGDRRVSLDVVDVRPRQAGSAGVIGTLSIDRSTAQLVRARFAFTPESYRDNTVEALTVLLDYARVDDRAWLPWRQVIEIRRNAGWLDLPYRGIIRATWDFGEYTLDTAITPAAFAGPAIGGLRIAGDSARPWPVPFDTALVAAGPVASGEEVALARAEVARAVEGRMASGLAPTRASASSISDLIHFDRVQGVAVGVGLRVESSGSRVVVKPSIGVGSADGRWTGGIDLTIPGPNSSLSTLDFYATRSIRDFSDLPVISRALNSLAAQEWGDDYGDYVLVEGVGLRLAGAGRQFDWQLRGGWEDPSRLDISATPARGTFRPQPDLGGHGYWLGGVDFGSGAAGGSEWRVGLSAGAGRTSWQRAMVNYRFEIPFVFGPLRHEGSLGVASAGTPAWRSFVMGGRGTLPGERFREWGGREMGWGSVEWRIPVPMPAIPIGDFATTGRRAVLAPFFAAGATGNAPAGSPWRSTPGVRSSAGVALELFYQLIRVEAGASLETGKWGVTFDVGRAWWGVL